MRQEGGRYKHSLVPPGRVLCMHAMCQVHGLSLLTVNFGLQYSDLVVGMASLKPHTEVMVYRGVA
jgi:hypothetical protein